MVLLARFIELQHDYKCQLSKCSVEYEKTMYLVSNQSIILDYDQCFLSAELNHIVALIKPGIGLNLLLSIH